VYNPQNAAGNVANYTMQCITRTNRHQSYFGTLEAQVAADNAGRVRISKIGRKQLRHILYTAALNAKKTNAACKALCDRPWKKGRTKNWPLSPFATNCSSKYLPC
jgi:hypothetical protein